ncbi:hypothetical protein SESBI_10302 [Sesbania bispinosa]|nr:hypothetical protein SESBI_10302 [Sesbania bispinosa]
MTSSITWTTPDPEEDAALKLLSRQGHWIFTGALASNMKDFLGQVGTWCLRGAMMAKFFHNTINEVAVLPAIKKDFEAVTQKLKAYEVKMTEAFGKAEWFEAEIEQVEDLWEESAECFFHTAINHIKFLNPSVELRTKGMNTLCAVHDGKWYRGVVKYFVEEMPGDEEICPPSIKPIPLKEDVEREEKKGPTEAEMVDFGLDATKLCRLIMFMTFYL